MMTFALGINLALVILCAAVALQSARMMRRIRELKADDLHGTIQALDHAAGHARQVLVLEEMRSLLTGDMAGAFNTVRTAQALHEELTMLIGIGNALADRIIDASASVESHQPHDVAANEAAGDDPDNADDDADVTTSQHDADDLHQPAPSLIA